MTRLRMLIFRLYEHRRLRNWFYSVAFLVFVSVGCRFATLAWRFGSWVDRPLTVIAGIFIGITTLVTLMRFWHVPPRRIATPAVPPPTAAPKLANFLANEFVAAARHRAAENRALASDAAALGSTMGKARYRNSLF